MLKFPTIDNKLQINKTIIKRNLFSMKIEKPLISVIIPLWNRENDIEKALESVLNQGILNIEIIVSDDGSTDGGCAVVEAFAERDLRIKLIKNPNGNSGLPAVARNLGLTIASGTWIAFLDSDDLMEPSKLVKQLEAAKRNSAEAICTNALGLLDEKIVTKSLIKTHAKNAEWLTLSKLLACNKIVTSSVMVKREILIASGGFPEDQELKAYEDYALWLKIATRSAFLFINEPLIRYSLSSPNSVRLKVRRQEFFKLKRVLLKTFSSIRNRDWLLFSIHSAKRLALEAAKDGISLILGNSPWVSTSKKKVTNAD